MSTCITDTDVSFCRRLRFTARLDRASGQGELSSVWSTVERSQPVIINTRKHFRAGKQNSSRIVDFTSPLKHPQHLTDATVLKNHVTVCRLTFIVLCTRTSWPHRRTLNGYSCCETVHKILWKMKNRYEWARVPQNDLKSSRMDGGTIVRYSRQVTKSQHA